MPPDPSLPTFDVPLLGGLVQPALGTHFLQKMAGERLGPAPTLVSLSLGCLATTIGHVNVGHREVHYGILSLSSTLEC